MKQGKIFIVSAPSGAGKSTLCNLILKKFPDILYSISYTTRKPRNNEKHGIAYFFITNYEFEKKIEKKFWAEWAKVHGNYYGTSIEFINQKIKSGKSLILDIDIQGAKKIAYLYPDAIKIFIMPLSFNILEQRLISRNTDSKDVIKKRLKNGRKEIRQKDFYDHVIINNKLEEAFKQINKIIEKAFL